MCVPQLEIQVTQLEVQNIQKYLVIIQSIWNRMNPFVRVWVLVFVFALVFMFVLARARVCVRESACACVSACVSARVSASE